MEAYEFIRILCDRVKLDENEKTPEEVREGLMQAKGDSWWSMSKDMDRTPSWGLMQCRIEQVLAFELGRVARLFTPHRLQAR